MPRLSTVVLVVTVAALVHGCCEPAPTVSPAGVPTELKVVRALHAPPEIEVTVERKSRKRGGGAGGCGHSPVCIILLPALLFNEAFPRKWDEATVTTDGQRTFHGQFTTGGDLITATTWDAETVRKYDVLDIQALGKNVVIESGTAPFVDGKAGTFTRRSIQEQVDLLGDYKKKLAKTKGAKRRTALLTEAMKWLGAEAEPMARAHMGAANEADPVRAGMIKWACERRSGWPDVPALLEAGRHKPGPLLSLEALRCGRATLAPVFVAGRPVEETAAGTYGDGLDLLPYARALTADLCAEGSGSKVRLRDLAQLTDDRLTAARKAGATCEDENRRVALRVGLAQDVDRAELAALLKSDEGLAVQVAERLDAKKADHRHALFIGLTGHPGRESYLRPLHAAGVVADEAETVVLAGSLASGGSFTGVTGHALSLALLHAARVGGTSPKRATAFLRTQIKKDAEDRLKVGMLVLGDPRYVPELLRSHIRYSTASSDPNKIHSTGELVTFAMGLVGCDRRQQAEAWAAAQKGSKKIPACARP